MVTYAYVKILKTTIKCMWKFKDGIWEISNGMQPDTMLSLMTVLWK
jgi:hypothetical protein